MSHHDSSVTVTPTLDVERTAQLRTFLTVEAAADAARTPSVGLLSTGRRRVLVGAAAALLLGGSLFAADAIVGAPGPAGVASAVEIIQKDGWSTVRLLDLDADPDDVVAQLEAAAIPVKRVPVPVTVGPDGTRTVTVEDMNAAAGMPTGDGATVTVYAGATGGVGERGLVALSVSRVGPIDGGGGDGSAESTRDAAIRDWQANGARFNDDGSMSIRTGSGNEVVVFTEA